MRIKRLLVALALIAAPAHAHVADRTFVVDARADADTLVVQLVSDDAMATLASRAFDVGMEDEVNADSDLKKQFDSHPGLKAHVAGMLRGEFLVILRRELPQLRRQLSAIVLADMTPAEITDTLVFFRSPVGQKLKTQVYASMADKPSRDQEQMKQAALAAVMSSLTAEDYPALMTFGASSAAQKMQTLNPKISAASEAWSAKLVADNDAHMRALAAKSVEAFLSRKKAS